LALMPHRFVAVRHRHSGALLAQRARWCGSVLCRLRGLMFRRALRPGEVLILDEGRDSRLVTAIHMVGVPFPIGAVWINSAGRVVDKVLALPWRPFYAPRAPARFIVEAAPEFLERVAVNDELDFVAQAMPAGA
jgi:uncharacterized membrane protein (UPF0127 family)